MSAPSSIAIVGAGLSGLVLARILQVNGVDATVYEAEASRETRPQGGVLDIHDDSGQLALRDAGLFEQFLERTHPGAEVGSVMGRDGRVLVEYRTPGGEGRGQSPSPRRGQSRRRGEVSRPPPSGTSGGVSSQLKSGRTAK